MRSSRRPATSRPARRLATSCSACARLRPVSTLSPPRSTKRKCQREGDRPRPVQPARDAPAQGGRAADAKKNEVLIPRDIDPIPHTSPRRSPDATASTRRSAQDEGRKAPLSLRIPAQSRPARRDQGRPVTLEVAGSSPVLSLVLIL